MATSRGAKPTAQRRPRRQSRARLRDGFTTGTAAAAAAKAAVLSALGAEVPPKLDTPLPDGGRLGVPIAACRVEGQGVRASVVKDGGDDPDATHKASIEAVVRLAPGNPGNPGNGGVRVRISGGRGVGVVTLPGLSVKVGEPAINPGPRRQIEQAVREAAGLAGFQGGIWVLIEVPDGEALARKTMNPRLGIQGGISILGTTGIVRPLSHDAWRAAVSQAMAVARAAGLGRVALTTGRTSERLFLQHFPDTPRLSVIQVGDHFAHALAEAGRLGFAEVVLAVFFGKLVKQAQGLPDTHAKHGRIDFAALAALCREAGLPEGAAAQVAASNTASQALETLLPGPCADAALDAVARRALASARGFIGPGPRLSCLLFHQDGRLLCRVEG